MPQEGYPQFYVGYTCHNVHLVHNCIDTIACTQIKIQSVIRGDVTCGAHKGCMFAKSNKTYNLKVWFMEFD